MEPESEDELRREGLNFKDKEAFQTCGPIKSLNEAFDALTFFGMDSWIFHIIDPNDKQNHLSLNESHGFLIIDIFPELSDELIRLANASISYLEERERKSKQYPGAPFPKTWGDFLLKENREYLRIMRYAAMVGGLRSLHKRVNPAHEITGKDVVAAITGRGRVENAERLAYQGYPAELHKLFEAYTGFTAI